MAFDGQIKSCETRSCICNLENRAGFNSESTSRLYTSPVGNRIRNLPCTKPTGGTRAEKASHTPECWMLWVKGHFSFCLTIFVGSCTSMAAFTCLFTTWTNSESHHLLKTAEVFGDGGQWCLSGQACMNGLEDIEEFF